MSDPPKIRRASLADAAPMVRLIHLAFAEYRGRLVPESGAFAESAESISGRLQQGPGFVVDGTSGSPIACLLTEDRGDTLYLGRLAVDPGHRRRGIGARLLREAEAFARQIGFSRLELGVRLVLSDNIRLFRRAGFLEIGLHAHDGFSEPTYFAMEKRLEPSARRSGRKNKRASAKFAAARSAAQTQ